MKPAAIRIVLVDDHKIMATALAEMLQATNEIQVLDVLTDGNKLLQFLNGRSDEVDLIILDVHMAELDGVSVLPIVKARFTNIKVIILTMYYTSKLINQVKEKGADAYIHKADEPEVLLQRIHEVMQGKKVFPVYQQASFVYTNEVSQDAFIKIAVLTDREKQVARLLRDGLTTPKIAAQLFLSEFTVDTHRKNILRKLELKSTPELIKFAIENKL
jgi:DNA-binding NarL/FixJ family response regulator